MLATVAASPLTIAWVMIWSLVSSFCLTSGDTLELSILCLYLLFQGTGATPSLRNARPFCSTWLQIVKETFKGLFHNFPVNAISNLARVRSVHPIAMRCELRVRFRWLMAGEHSVQSLDLKAHRGVAGGEHVRA